MKMKKNIYIQTTWRKSDPEPVGSYCLKYCRLFKCRSDESGSERRTAASLLHPSIRFTAFLSVLSRRPSEDELYIYSVSLFRLVFFGVFWFFWRKLGDVFVWASPVLFWSASACLNLKKKKNVVFYFCWANQRNDIL